MAFPPSRAPGWPSKPHSGLKSLSLVPIFVLTCLASGCGKLEFGNMRTPSEVILAGIESWRDNASPEDQAAIDKLVSRQGVFIHVILGDLSGRPSRGAMSFPRSNQRLRKYCIFHPVVNGIDPDRNWDVIYDSKMEEEYGRLTRLSPSFECTLQHEIIGHIAPTLDDPKLLDRLERDQQLRDKNELEARVIENRCRRRMKLPEVPEFEPNPEDQ